MATYAENLVTARDNLAAKIAAISADPKPTYTDGTRTVSWETYYRMLSDQLKAMNELIAAATPDEIGISVRAL